MWLRLLWSFVELGSGSPMGWTIVETAGCGLLKNMIFLIAWWSCFWVGFQFFQKFTSSYMYLELWNCLYESTSKLVRILMGGRRGERDLDQAKPCSKRTKEQVQGKNRNRNRNNTFESDTPAGLLGFSFVWIPWNMPKEGRFFPEANADSVFWLSGSGQSINQPIDFQNM